MKKSHLINNLEQKIQQLQFELKDYIDPYSRQQNLSIDLLYVRNGYCACGCGSKLNSNQQKWKPGHYDLCYWAISILNGKSFHIRKALYIRDKGICFCCGRKCSQKEWEAHHVLPISDGGGGCTLKKIATVYKKCHQNFHNQNV